MRWPKNHVFGIGHLIVGEVEDAEIDRRDHDIGIGRRRQAGHRDRNRQRLARLRLVDGAERYGELPGAGIDGQPFDADGAGRHARLLRLAGPEEGCRHIGAGAPIVADRDVDRRAALGHAGGQCRQQRLGTDRHQQLAGKARRDFQPGDLARRIFVLVERDLQPVGRLGRRLRRHTSRRRIRSWSPAQSDPRWKLRAGSGPSRPATRSWRRQRRWRRSCPRQSPSSW